MTKQEFLAMSLPIYKNKLLSELEGESFQPYSDNPFYMVSNLGRIKSIDREVNHNYGGKAIKKSKILTQTENQSGYLSVGITFEGKTKNVRVSRMVATTFIPNYENKPQVNHINGDKKDNRVENLEWATSGENVRHAWNNNLAKKQSSFLYIQRRLEYINKYITHGVRVVTPIGFGVVIIDQSCYRIQYDNGKLENLVKSVRFWRERFKLCLRSLSDLTKPIEHKGEKFVPIIELLKNSSFDTSKMSEEEIMSFGEVYSRIDLITLNDLPLYLQWHFDLFGGIESGEAINVNTLDTNPYK